MPEAQMPVTAEMPRYRCHKEVRALKIYRVKRQSGGFVTLIFENSLYASRSMTSEWVKKHEPKAGGYYVVYGDGYESWSPAEAFEAGYSLIRLPE